MIPTGHLVAFVLASVVLVLIPGPSVVFVVGRALAHGRRVALRSVVGNSTGAAVLVILVSVGLGSVVARSLAAFTVVKLLGAGYLVYLGVRTWRERHELAGALRHGTPAGASRHAYRQGVLVGATNPKTMVFFAAVLPQFADPAAGHLTVQLVLLGLVFVLVALLLDSVWGLAAGTARDWFARSPGRVSALGGAGGLSMVGLGVGLAVAGRSD
jgi:threonine/homoserine/homoserine lactone efflux protein